MRTNREPRQFLGLVSMGACVYEGTLTSNLFEALVVLLGDSVVLLLQRLQTARQRVCDLCVVVLETGAILAVVHGVLHLLDGLDQALRLFCHLVLLICDDAQLAVQRVRKRREELCCC
jgi:hypothetical protein